MVCESILVSRKPTNQPTKKMTIIETNEQFEKLEKNGTWFRSDSSKAYKTVAGVKRAWAAMEKDGGCDDIKPVAVNFAIGGWSRSSGYGFFLCGK